MNKLKILGLCLAILPLSACGLSGGPMEGEVFDAVTKKPLPDTYVDFRWQGRISFGGASVCAHTENTITDQQGRFSTPGWKAESKNGVKMDSDVPFFDVYKAGYSLENLSDSEFSKAVQEASKDNDKDKNKSFIFMKPYAGTKEERLQYLEVLSSRLQCFGTDEKSLFQIQRAIYLEGKALAVSDSDKERVRGLRFNAANILLEDGGKALGLYETEELIQKDNYLKEQLK